MKLRLMGATVIMMDEAVLVPAETVPTIWGLGPMELHDRYWASRGVQIVRAGHPVRIDRKAELFLLMDQDHLVLFDLQNWIELLDWTKPDLLLLRLHARTDLRYCEVLTADDEGEFLRFERRYKSKQILTTRVGLTCERDLAEAWLLAKTASAGWRQLRWAVPSTYREVRTCPARIYRRSIADELAQFVEDLVGIWSYPDSTILRATKTIVPAWVDPLAKVDRNARIVGPVWVGAGRQLSSTDVVIGPAVLWDDPLKRPPPGELDFAQIEPTGAGPRSNAKPNLSEGYRIFKRGFDIIFSILALLITLPLYPLIMLAIFLEDGRPFFFSHERETLKGRLFRCIKFRSMRKGALEMASGLESENQADGPQFYIRKDPRVTRVGKILRDAHVDELPQFFNVLLGHMSVVGPRPSPSDENKFCAEWRDARLSVRPGITGLWQVQRTRLRGKDFQEWIKYDIQYVENMGLAMDLRLMWQTVIVICRRTVRS
jgi:lipopolysaccharide/colanic/teichoic acid biosynthesis glycosyltransferase